MPEIRPVVVDCPADHLPAVGALVRVERGPDDENGATWALIAGDHRLSAMGSIGEDQVPIDMTFIDGVVDRIEEMHPIPNAFPSEEVMLQYVAEFGPRWAVWVSIETGRPHSQAR